MATNDVANKGTTTARGQGGRTVYYRGPGIVVTSQFVVTAGGRHPIAALTEVRRIQRRTYRARGSALVAGAVGAVLTAALANLFGPPALIAGGTVIVAGLVAGLVLDHRANTRRHALMAICEGREVELFSSGDKHEFGQVCRALLRAVQFNRPPLPEPGGRRQATPM